MADISIKKLNESFIEISAPEDITYNIYARYSEYVSGYQFQPRFKMRVWDGKHHSFLEFECPQCKKKTRVIFDEDYSSKDPVIKIDSVLVE